MRGLVVSRRVRIGSGLPLVVGGVGLTGEDRSSKADREHYGRSHRCACLGLIPSQHRADPVSLARLPGTAAPASRRTYAPEGGGRTGDREHS